VDRLSSMLAECPVRRCRSRARSPGAAFVQNALQRIEAGSDAEVAFDAVPGRVFGAKVRSVGSMDASQSKRIAEP
jgi:multidrug resistance efflux pump